jgi:hypothetical protein
VIRNMLGEHFGHDGFDRAHDPLPLARSLRLRIASSIRRGK